MLEGDRFHEFLHAARYLPLIPPGIDPLDVARYRDEQAVDICETSGVFFRNVWRYAAFELADSMKWGLSFAIVGIAHREVYLCNEKILRSDK
jgi:hypothetical protein